MLKRCFPVLGAAALVLVLSSPGSGRAQMGTYWSEWGRDYVVNVSYGGYAYGNLGLGMYPGYPLGFTATSIAIDPMTYVAFYPPLFSTRAPVAAPAPGVVSRDRSATVEVLAPDDAVLIFDGHKTRQIGNYRLFATPPLTKGDKYHYTVEATFVRDGKKVTQKQRVAVSAGATSTVAFPMAK